MQLIVRRGETGPEEWFMIEMQGDLESRNKDQVQGKFIGDLHFTKQGITHSVADLKLLILHRLPDPDPTCQVITGTEQDPIRI